MADDIGNLQKFKSSVSSSWSTFLTFSNVEGLGSIRLLNKNSIAYHVY